MPATANADGRVVWITGLSGAGKSTLAQEVVRRLREDAFAPILLDGDEIRAVLGGASASGSQHTREARLALGMTYARLAQVLALQGHVVVVATISMFREIHEWNRENLPGYLEVYLRVPVDERRRRDPKCIYERYDRGELAHVAGLDIPVDEPQQPHMVLTGSSMHETWRASQSIVLAITRQESSCKPNGITRHWPMPT